VASDQVNVIHCDLKPENILLVHEGRTLLKVIDFGSSCRGDKTVFTYIQSRFYRSPEIVMGLPYSQAIDMWSLGCILVELHVGRPLFPGKTEEAQMKKWVETLGLPPVYMVELNPKCRKYFNFQRSKDNETRFNLKDIPMDVNPQKTSLEEIIGVHTHGPKGRWEIDIENHQEDHYLLFVDLIKRMLEYDQNKRIDPFSALHHPFLRQQQQQE